MSKKYLVVVIVLVLVVLRFMYLDQDTPSYFVGGICQEDEAYYSIEAINYLMIDEGRNIKGFDHNQLCGLLYHNTPFVYASLKIFGNNYWGLRIPAVIFSLLAILLLYKALKNLKINKQLLVAFLLYLLTDFYFFIFSRFETPQIYSYFIICLFLYFFTKYELKSKKSIMVLSFIAFTAFSLFYVYNLFFMLAYFVFVLTLWWRSKNYKLLLYYFYGNCAGVLFFAFVLFVARNSLTEIIYVLTQHKGGVIASQSDFTVNLIEYFKNVYRSLLSIFLTGFFRYNLSLLLLFCFIFPFIIKSAINKNKIFYFVLLCFVFQFLQGIFVMSYPFKKLIVLEPLVLLSVFYFFNNVNEFKNLFSDKLKLLFLGIGVLVSLYNLKTNNSASYWSGLNYGYYENVPKWLMAVNIGFVAFTILFTLSKVFSFKVNKSVIEKAIWLPLVMGLFCVIYFCFINKKFELRNLLTELKPVLKNEIILTGFPHAFQFYSYATPCLSNYEGISNFGNKTINQLVDSFYVNGIARYKLSKQFKYQKDDTLNFILQKKYNLTYFNYCLYKYKPK